jgi:hypothetical protein
MLRPLDDCVLYTYIVVGRWLPARATLTEAELPTPAFLAWLASWSYAQVDTWAGLAGVKALHIILMIGTFSSLCIWQGLVIRRIQGTEPSFISLGAGMMGAFLVSATNSSARTQDFTYFCFALLLLLLERWSRASHASKALLRQTVWLFILLVLWQNAHATVLLSLPVIAAYVFWRKSPWWYLLLPPVASICTVNGLHIFPWTATNVAISRDLLGISEWLHPWDAGVREAMLPFWILATVLYLSPFSTKTNRGVWDRTTTTISLLFFGLTLTSARFGALWGFVTAPLLGQVATALWPGSLAMRGLHSARSAWYWIVAGLALAALPFNPAPLLPTDSPLPLFRSLKTQYPSARIFNYREYGGALEYVGSPHWKVYIDGRILLFTPETWRRYESIAIAQDRSLVDEVARTHDLLVLHPSYHRALIEVLKTQTEAQLLAETTSVVIVTTRAHS